MKTDNQLIRKIKKKQDKQAADELIRRYYQEIYAYTYRQTGERELALDLTQEIFITVLRGIYAFDEKKAGFRTWTYRVAANKITDYYRSKSYKKGNCSNPCSGKQEMTWRARCVICPNGLWKKNRLAKSWTLSFAMSVNGFAFFRKNALRRKRLRRLPERWSLRRVP